MTFFETAGQGRTFLLLLYAGAAAAVLMDGNSLLRSRLPRPLRTLLDLLVCLCTALLCLLALAAGGENRLRLYAFLGLVCGAGIYCLGIRSLVAAIVRLIRRGKNKTQNQPDGNP